MLAATAMARRDGRSGGVLQRIKRRDDDAHPSECPEADGIAKHSQGGLGSILRRKRAVLEEHMHDWRTQDKSVRASPAT